MAGDEWRVRAPGKRTGRRDEGEHRHARRDCALHGFLGVLVVLPGFGGVAGVVSVDVLSVVVEVAGAT